MTGKILPAWFIVTTLCITWLLGCVERPAPTPQEKPPATGLERMVFVPAGTFIMGSLEGKADEQPQRKVYLDAFYIDKYEVTNAEYQAFVKATGRPEPMGIAFVEGRLVTGFRPWQDTRFNKPDQPVVCVSWEDAAAYAAWAGKRLPTEAEWEKAARGTRGRIYPWGDFWETERCNSIMLTARVKPKSFLEFYSRYIEGEESTVPAAARSQPPAPMPVGSFPNGKSPYGCFDMAGNVAEWVADYYDKKYYSTAPPKNPSGPAQGTHRVIRGGGFLSGVAELRCSARMHEDPRYWASTVGFRCAMSATPDGKPLPPPPESKAPTVLEKPAPIPPPPKPAVEEKKPTPAPPKPTIEEKKSVPTPKPSVEEKKPASPPKPSVPEKKIEPVPKPTAVEKKPVLSAPAPQPQKKLIPQPARPKKSEAPAATPPPTATDKEKKSDVK